MTAVPPLRFATVAARAATVACLACLLAACGVTVPSGPIPGSPATTGSSGATATATVSGSATVTPAPSLPAGSPGASGTAPSTAKAPANRLRGHLAVLLWSAGSSRLRLVGPVGVAVDVTPPARSAIAIAAGPDGRLVARAAGGTLWLTVASPSPPRSPDGPRLEVAWSALAPRFGAGPTLPGPIVGITWDPGGQRLLALATDPGGADDRIGLVTIRAADGASAATVVRARPGGGLAWSLAGGRRAFVARTRADQSVVAVADGDSVGLLAVPAYEVAFSGDRAVAAILAPDGSVRAGTTDDVLAGRLTGVVAAPSPETEAAGFALDATGGQLAVAWRSTDGADGILVVYGAIGGAWRETLRTTIAAEEVAVPAWLP